MQTTDRQLHAGFIPHLVGEVYQHFRKAGKWFSKQLSHGK
jgi:hypothetical protein